MSMQISRLNVSSILDEAKQALCSDKGGRPLRRFLERLVMTEGSTVIEQEFTNGLNMWWPRQMNRIEHLAKKAIYGYYNESNDPALYFVPPEGLKVTGPFRVKKTGRIYNRYELDADYLTGLSVTDLSYIVGFIRKACYYHCMLVNDPNYCVFDARSQDYGYRGLPSLISSLTWYVGGHDKWQGGSGVLEWCIDEADAKERMELMAKHKRFEGLTVGQS